MTLEQENVEEAAFMFIETLLLKHFLLRLIQNGRAVQ